MNKPHGTALPCSDDDGDVSIFTKVSIIIMLNVTAYKAVQMISKNSVSETEIVGCTQIDIHFGLINNIIDYIVHTWWI